MAEDYFAAGAEQEPAPWYPTPALQRALAVGIWATLVAGTFMIAEAALAMLPGQDGAAALIHGLGWLALIPGFWIVAAYVRLGEETGYRSLVTTSVCLFVALVVFQLYDLINMDVLPWIAQTTLWVLFVLGLIVLAILPFALKEGKSGAIGATATDAVICRAASPALQPGQRVLAHYCRSGRWYAGALASIQADGFHVTYDDGDRETVTADCVLAENLLAPGKLAVGDRVLGRWWNGSCYYAGMVTEVAPEQANICYDDGDVEWCKLDVVRLAGAGDLTRPPLSESVPEEAGIANAPDAPPRKGIGAKVMAALGSFWGIIIIVRVIAKGAVGFAAGRGAAAIPGNITWLEIVGGILGGLMLIFLAVYYVWFAVAKIVARSKLGGVAALLGTAELLGLLAMAGVLAWAGVQVAIAAAQPGGVTDDQMKEIETQLNATSAPLEFIMAVGWATLTMWLFWSVRSRHDPAADLRAATDNWQ